MFVVIKKINVHVESKEETIIFFKQKTPLYSFKGFIKRDIMVGQTKEEIVTIMVQTCFKNKDAYLNWHKSDEHALFHKTLAHNKLKGVTSKTKEIFEWIDSYANE